MSIKGIIFDFNGVIVDDYPIQKAAWDKVSFKLRGRPVTNAELIKKIRGLRIRDTILKMANRDLGEDDIEALEKFKEKITKELYQASHDYRLNNGLESFLNDLMIRKIKRTIATSSSLEMTKFSFRKLNLDRWFEFEKIIYNDGKHKGKPHPDPYLLAAGNLGLKPGECVVFEDAKSGIQAAYQAGIGKIFAVGSKERLETFSKLPGITRGIRDFREINVSSVLA